MGLRGLMSRGSRTLACLAAGLWGAGSSALPLDGDSVAIAADKNAYRSVWPGAVSGRPHGGRA